MLKQVAVVGLLVGGVILPRLAAGQGVVAQAVVSNPTPLPSASTIDVAINVNMSGTGARLGAFSGTLGWNPSVLQYVRTAGGTSPGFGAPLFRADRVGSGTLSFNGINVNGGDGDVNVLNVTFSILGSAGDTSQVDLAFSSLVAAGSFENLLLRTNVVGGVVSIMALPDIQILPEEYRQHIDFGVEVPNTGSVKIVEIENNSPRSLDIAFSAIDGVSFSTSRSNLSSFSLPPTQALEVEVYFHPPNNVRGVMTDTLTITWPDGFHRIVLMGEATAPRIRIDGVGRDFGEVLVGSDSTMIISVRNEGTEYLNIEQVEVVEASLTVEPFQLSILPGNSDTLRLAYTPVSRGRLRTDIYFDSNDPDIPRWPLEISARAVRPEAESTLDSLVFGPVRAGADTVVSFWIKNKGDYPLAIKKWAFSHDWLQASLPPGPVSVGKDSIEIMVQAKIPVGVGSDSLRITTNDLVDSMLVLPVRWIGTENADAQLVGDFDGNKKVDFDDFFIFADAFGGTNPVFDFDKNGRVDFDDFFIFADNFGKTTNGITVGSFTSTPPETTKGVQSSTPPGEPSTSPSLAGKTISGIIYYSTTHLGGVKVELIPGDLSNLPLQTATSSSTGTYEFYAVQPGDYHLKIYGPTTEYAGWVASQITVSDSPITLDLDLPKKLRLISPANNETVNSLRPLLTWNPIPEAATYTVQVNVTSSWQLAVWPKGITTVSYRVASDLLPGTEYTWMVEAYDAQGHYVAYSSALAEFHFTTPRVQPISSASPSASKTITADLPGGAKMEFVWIEPGTFTMGSPSSELGRDSQDENQHQVTISRGFYLGKYEITQGQWKAVLGTEPWLGHPEVQENPNNPAVNISWAPDLQAFIHRLNMAAGDSLYRLPTEAEWEYACRAGTTTRWSFGDAESQLRDYAWYANNAWNVGERYAHAVGAKKPNPWGLYDMHGNVWEFVQDGTPLGDAVSYATRYWRGGGVYHDAPYTRSAIRGYDMSYSGRSWLGARLLRVR